MQGRVLGWGGLRGADERIASRSRCVGAGCDLTDDARRDVAVAVAGRERPRLPRGRRRPLAVEVAAPRRLARAGPSSATRLGGSQIARSRRRAAR